MTSTTRRDFDSTADKARAVIGLSAAATVLLVANAAFAAPASCSWSGDTTQQHVETAGALSAMTREELRTEE